MDVQKKNARLERRLARRISVGLLAAACGLWTLAPAAFAEVTPPADTQLPVFDSVVAGDVENPATTGNVMDIKQTSDRAIIKWDSFDVGKDATVNFIQTKDGVQNTAAITLNRVSGNNLSQIYGKINSIGSVVLVNPNGILFGAGSEVNAAGIVASTADIAEGDDFINNGELTFVQTNVSNNNITVLGSLNAAINGSYLDSSVAGSYGTYLAASPLNLGERQVVTEVSTVGNKIMLVADGDVAVSADASLTAVTNTTIDTSTTNLGDGFTVTNAGATEVASGTIIIRADQNADNVNATKTAATVTIADPSGDKQIQSLNVKLYYNDEITDSAADVATIGITKDETATFTQKNYTSGYGATLEGKVADSVTAFENAVGELPAAATKTTTVSKKAYSLINDLYQLQAIDGNNTADNLTYSYALGKNIDASDTISWTNGAGFNPIGSLTNKFTGSFSGSGGTANYNIYDLNINRSTTDYNGLFAVVSGDKKKGNGVISDVTIVDPLIAGQQYTGALAGKVQDQATISNITMRKRVAVLDGATTSATAKVNVTGSGKYVGGLIGYLASSTVSGAVNGGYVNGDAAVVGGIIGQDDNGTLSGLVNRGYYSKGEDVNTNYGVVVGASSDIGGLVGIMNGTTTLTASYSNGKVSGGTYSNGTWSAGTNVGGLVGTTYPNSGTISITKSYNTNVPVIGKANIITTEEELNTKSVYGTVSGVDYVGGIVGKVGSANSLTISNCYNAGNISASNGTVGGIVGMIYGMASNTAPFNLIDCYNADNNTIYIEGGNYAGFKYNGKEYAYNKTENQWYEVTAPETLITEKELATLVQVANRQYTTRLVYRDATVSGTNSVGGIAGYMINGNNSTINYCYSAGKVSGSGAQVGGIVGASSSASAVWNSFVVTTDSVGNNISGVTKAYGGTTVAGGGTKTLAEAKTQQLSDGNYTTTPVTWYNNGGSTTPLLQCFMSGTIDLGNREYEYDGTAHIIDTSGLDLYFGNGTFSGTTGRNASTNEALYTKSDLWSPQSGYITSATSGMTVKAKELTYEVAADNEKTYGDAVDASKFGEFEGVAYGDDIGTLAVDAFTITSADGSVKDATLTANTDKGTYTLSVDTAKVATLLKGNSNYTLGEVKNGSLTINPRELKYTISSATKVYGDTALDTVTGAWSGLVDGESADDLGDIDYSALESTGLVADAPVTADGYTMTVKSGTDLSSLITNSNYKLADKDGLVINGKLMVTQRGITFDVKDASMTYGDSTISGGFSTLVNGDDFGAIKLTDAITNGSITEKTGAGEHSGVTVDKDAIAQLVTDKGKGNYTLNDANSNFTGTLNIAKRTVGYAVGDQTKTYGDTALTTTGGFTGVINNDALGNYSVDSSALSSAGLTKKADVDTYTDLKVADTSKLTALIDNYGGGNYTLDTDNITGGTLTVEALGISFDASNLTKTYGDTTLTGGFSTLVDDDNLGTFGADDITSGAEVLAANAAVKGNYSVTVKTDAIQKLVYANKNYKLDTITNTGTPTITPRTITFDVKDATKVYGDSVLKGGFSTLVTGDNLDGISLDAITAGNVTATTNAGTQAITLSAQALSDFVATKGDGNYTLDTAGGNLSGDLTIAARPIGYAVGNQTKTYGDDSSTISGTGNFTGLFEGSEFADKSLEASDLVSDGLATKATVNGGEAYTLTVRDGALADFIKENGNGNYVLSDAADAVEDGTLTVNARSVTFDLAKQAITYGDKSIAGNFTTVVDGDDLGAITVDVLSSGSDVLNGTTAVKGDHAITIDSAKLAKQVETNGNGNYTLDTANSTLSGNLTINAKALTYTLADQTLQYGDKATTGTLAGFVNGDSIATDSLTVSADGAGHLTDAGKTYGISVKEGDVSSLVTTAGSGNYTIATDGNKYTGTVTVTQRQVGYTVGDQTKTYGDGADGISGTGSFTNLFEGSELAGASLAASDLTSDGLGEQADVKTDGSTYKLTVADNQSLADLIKNKGGDNYILSTADGAVTAGTLTVNAKDINYSVGNLEREYLTDGGYTGADATASGVMSWDKDKLANINYTTNANLDSDAQAGYTISTTVKDVQDALGTNYNVTGVTDGTLTITPTTVYYKADSLSYSKKDGELALTGSIVKADGTTVLGATDVNKYLTAADYAALRFIVVDADGNTVDTTSGIDKGEYSIIGTGITGGQNYVLGNPSDWYTNSGAKSAMLTVLGTGTADLVPDLGQYEGAKDDLGASSSTDNGSGLGQNELALRRGGIIGGAIPSMDRVQFSFKSVESTGINVGTAPQSIYEITVAPSSYAVNNGGGDVTIAQDERKSVRIARDGEGAARPVGMNDEQQNHITFARDAAGAARSVAMNDAQENHVSMANSADNNSDEDEQKKA